MSTSKNVKVTKRKKASKGNGCFTVRKKVRSIHNLGLGIMLK